MAETLAGLPTGGSTVTMWRERPTLFPGMPLVQSGSGVSDLLDAKRVRTFVNELGAVELMYLRP